MAKKVQLQTNGKEWQVIDGEQVLVDVEKRDIDPITSSSCIQIEGFRTLEEAVSDNKMLSQDLTYTKVMDKVGGDYHQNVLDGQYSKAILYGNTQVNLCEEDTSVALQIPTTFTSFNNGELQINNKENQVVAPLIKGVTMVNLAQTNSASITSGNATVIQNVKGNTVYTLSFTFTTKNTNSGVTIQCYDGNGTFIENTMHKTGLGDVVKFTFTTHANAAKIHICNNPAYGGETIQLDEIMLIEGDQTALDIPFFRGMKSVELVRPLTNLFSNDLEYYNANVTSTNNNGAVAVTASSNNSWANVQYTLTNLKANTNYLVMWDSVSTTQTSTTNTDILICMVQASNNGNLGRMDNNSLNPTKRCMMFNTGNIPLTDIALRVHATLGNTETATTTVTGLRVFEYDDYLRSVDLQSIGWFSGTKNVAVEPIKTCSKNLYPYGDINFTPTYASSWCDAKGNAYMTGDIASKSQTRFLLRKGNYTISSSSLVNCAMQVVGDKEEVLTNGIQSGANATFILDKDTYCTVRFKSFEANVTCTSTNIQIERGTTATDYVAHDSRYYEPNGQNAIVLRSLPDGLCDTFNLQTGEYTRRIGEVVLNGASNEGWIANHKGASYQFILPIEDATSVLKDNKVATLNSDTIPSVPNHTILTEELNVEKWGIAQRSNGNKGVFIAIPASAIETYTVECFKQWLSQNPITVQYELAIPVTTIIPRTIKRNNNGAVSTVDFKTYTNKENLRLPSNPTFLTINSMTSIKPVVEPITYFDFKTRLKANTDYSVIIDKNSTDKTINLGGTSKTYTDKMLVRTPSINLEQNLRISGSGSIQNIMVIEGDVLDKELPYFNGMCNVKMPIVRNTCKNLCNFDEHKTNWWVGSGGLFKGDSTANNYSVIIPASVDNYYMISMIGTDRNIYGFLDKDYNVIYLDAGYKNITIKAPSNTRYLIWYLSSTGLTKENNIMITASKSSSMTTVPYEPYRGNDICIVQGEIGLSQDMFEQGGFGGSAGNTYDNCKANTNTNIRMRTKGLITVKPNTTYIVNNNTSPNMNHVFYLFDESQKYLGSNITVNAKSFVTPNNCRYVSLMFSKNSNANISVSEFKQELFQLLELDSTVQLRSLPNGVKDELNLLTGEYIQRVGEVVLNGKNNQFIEGLKEQKGDYLKFGMQLNPVAPYNHNVYLLNDRFNSETYSTSKEGQQEQIYIHTHSSTNTELRVCILPSKLSTPDNVGFNSYLQSNPITVQYELAEPIISYPRIVSNTQEREVGVKLPNGVCDTYNPSTGVTVKRVGKVILDGSENWRLYGTNVDNETRLCLTEKPDAKIINTPEEESVMSDKLPCDYNLYVNDKEGIHIFSNPPQIAIRIKASKLSTIDASGLKEWLSQNPITVWYEFKYPQVTTDIVLPNGVHDVYNPLTGLYTKRIGLIEFDGSDDENWVSGTSTTATFFDGWGAIIPNIKTSGYDSAFVVNNSWTTAILCDNVKVGAIIGEEHICVSLGTNNKCKVSLGLTSSKLATCDLATFKTYLSQNPVKVWYELDTPITYQLTPYFGLPMPYAYKDGYLIMDSAYDGQTLPPEITYQLTVNRTGQITQNNIKLKEHTARLSNLEYILIEATLDSIFSREMQNFELELMNVELFNLNE